MQVHVVLMGNLAGAPTPGGTQRAVEVPDGADAAALMAACGLDRRGCVVVINGAVASPTTTLRPDDRVQVYAVQAGG